MKVRHNPYLGERQPDPVWAERVEREAEQHTARSESAWNKAKRRLDRSVEKAEQAESQPSTDVDRVAKLWRVVEARRQELKDLERLTQATPAGAQHRGRGSHRGVALGDPL